MNRIFLDSHSTTPLDPAVLESMIPWLTDRFGNAASHNHAFGWEAAEAVERARGQVAALVGCEAGEVIFTSGATEANNLAIKGVAASAPARSRHIVSCIAEHRAVLDPIAQLERAGFSITRIPISQNGLLDTGQVIDAIRDETVLVSVMHANNETGIINDVATIGHACAGRGVVFHCDASQSAGKITVTSSEWNINLLSLSAHKMYGPKGVGVLVCRRGSSRMRLQAQIHGGGHEKGLRSGTLNVPGIVGLGRAAEIAMASMHSDSQRLAHLRDKLRRKFLESLDAVEENGDPAHKLPHSLNLSFGFVQSSAVLDNIGDHIAISTGSACSSNDPEPSHVLLALGHGPERALSSLRFGLLKSTTEDDIDTAAAQIIDVVRRLRGQSPLYGPGG